MLGFIGEILIAIPLLVYRHVHHAIGLGYTRRELERECDALGLHPYTPMNLYLARRSLEKQNRDAGLY